MRALLAGMLAVSATSASLAQGDRLQTILDRGELSVFAYNFPPEAGLNPDTQEPEGFDIDIWHAIGNELGVQVTFKFFQETTLANALNGGQADSAAGHQYTEERAKILSYSDPYWCVTQVVAARKGSGISSFEDLKGKTVGSVRGTAEALTLQQLSGEFQFTERTFDLADPMLRDLAIGRVDAVVWDDFLIRWAMKTQADFAQAVEIAAVIPPKYTGGKEATVHFIFPKEGSEALRDKVNELLLRFQTDGTLARAFEKWGLDPGAMKCSGQ
ncbi:MAG: substrate-binding periplasmic protein [Dongiaceae bacterium]